MEVCERFYCLCAIFLQKSYLTINKNIYFYEDQEIYDKKEKILLEYY